MSDGGKLWARMQHYTDNDGIPRGSSWMFPSMRIPVGQKMEGEGGGGIMTPVEARNITFLQEHLEFVCDGTQPD